VRHSVSSDTLAPPHVLLLLLVHAVA
jgi:hypothetical protein